MAVVLPAKFKVAFSTSTFVLRTDYSVQYRYYYRELQASRNFEIVFADDHEKDRYKLQFAIYTVLYKVQETRLRVDYE
jgi:hypothetical protein